LGEFGNNIVRLRVVDENMIDGRLTINSCSDT